MLNILENLYSNFPPPGTDNNQIPMGCPRGVGGISMLWTEQHATHNTCNVWFTPLAWQFSYGDLSKENLPLFSHTSKKFLRQLVLKLTKATNSIKQKKREISSEENVIWNLTQQYPLIWNMYYTVSRSHKRKFSPTWRRWFWYFRL